MSTSTSTSTYISANQIKPGDIIKFEYGTYDNWVTVRIDEVHIDPLPFTYYPLILIWHYLSDEKEASKEDSGASKDCRAEKLGNNPTPAPSPAPYRQFTCYSNLNDLVEKLN